MLWWTSWLCIRTSNAKYVWCPKSSKMSKSSRSFRWVKIQMTLDTFLIHIFHQYLVITSIISMIWVNKEIDNSWYIYFTNSLNSKLTRKRVAIAVEKMDVEAMTGEKLHKELIKKVSEALANQIIPPTNNQNIGQNSPQSILWDIKQNSYQDSIVS